MYEYCTVRRNQVRPSDHQLKRFLQYHWFEYQYNINLGATISACSTEGNEKLQTVETIERRKIIAAADFIIPTLSLPDNLT